MYSVVNFILVFWPVFFSLFSFLPTRALASYDTETVNLYAIPFFCTIETLTQFMPSEMVLSVR